MNILLIRDGSVLDYRLFRNYLAGGNPRSTQDARTSIEALLAPSHLTSASKIVSCLVVISPLEVRFGNPGTM